MSVCSDCNRERVRHYYEARPGLKSLTDRRYRAANRDAILLAEQARRAADPERVRQARRRDYEKHKAARLAASVVYRKKNAKRIRALSRQWFERNRSKASAYSKGYVARNKTARAESVKRYRATHRERLLAEERQLRATPEQRAYSREYCMRRNAAKLKATPQWSNQFFMREIYALAALRTTMLGVPLHVDHIVPLKSDLVCGLHCEFNLAIMPAVENIRKGNRTWPDMP